MSEVGAGAHINGPGTSLASFEAIRPIGRVQYLYLEHVLLIISSLVLRLGQARLSYYLQRDSNYSTWGDLFPRPNLSITLRFALQREMGSRVLAWLL